MLFECKGEALYDLQRNRFGESMRPTECESMRGENPASEPKHTG